MTEDSQRPRFYCREPCTRSRTCPFLGLNRAQAAVVEAAILVSRLQMLPAAKIERRTRLSADRDHKTAGEAEREAWAWLMEAVADAGIDTPSEL